MSDNTELELPLKQLVNFAPNLKQALPYDCMIGITDTEKFLLYLPAANLNLGDVTGKPIPKEDAIYMAIQSGNVQKMKVPKEAFGVSFKANAVPIKDKAGKIIGGIGVGVSIENQEKLHAMAQLFASTSEEISASTQETASHAEGLVNTMNHLISLQQEINTQVNNTEKILGIINSIANNSKILGLNAGIEAARAGEHGKGFGIVAKEVRKMAENSSNSVSEIRDLIQQLRSKVGEIEEAVQKVTQIADDQSTASLEISNAMEQLASTAEDMEELAKHV